MRIFKSKKLHFLFLSIVVLQFAYLSKVSQADDFQALSADVQQGGQVNVLVSGGWNAVTGDIDPADLATAVTGEINIAGLQQKFLGELQAQGGHVEQLYEFEYLPFAMLKVDSEGLKNVKNYSSNVKVWKDFEVTTKLNETTEMVGATSHWRQGGTGEGQVIAVIDTGIDADHPMVRGKVVYEACIIWLGCKRLKSFVAGPGASMTSHPHGLHVAAIAAGNGNGFKGVAPEADIVSIKVLSDYGGGRSLDILKALDHVYKLVDEDILDISVVNMSLGGGAHKYPCYSSPYNDAALMLRVIGVTVVAASGNESLTNAISSPACASNIISVGAIDKDWNIASFSNASEDLDILAPGVAVQSAALDKNGKHIIEAYSGTSMAAPHVAGAFAIMKQLYPEMAAREILSVLKGGLLRDQRNGLTFPVLKIPGQAGTPNAGTPTPSNPQPTPSQPAQPQPVPSNSGGTIAITG